MARNVLKDIPCCSINERGFVVLMFTQFVIVIDYGSLEK